MSATDLKAGGSLLLRAFTTGLTKRGERDHCTAARLQHTVYLVLHRYAQNIVWKPFWFVYKLYQERARTLANRTSWGSAGQPCL